MDLESSVISCTAIIMVGIAFMKYLSLKRSSNSDGANGNDANIFKAVHKVVSEKLKELVSKRECDKQIKAFEHEFELTRETIRDGFADIKEDIKNNKV